MIPTSKFILLENDNGLWLFRKWVPDGCDDCNICTANWLIQTSLEFRKRLVNKDFILKRTKLLLWLPWPSTKLSKIFISSNLNSVFLSCSVLSAKTDPLVCVDSVFWMEFNNCFFCTFSSRVFFAMLGILSTPLFWWSKWTALCTLSRNCPLLTKILSLNRYLKSVFRQSTC